MDILSAKIRQQNQYSIACKTKPHYLLITGFYFISYVAFFLTGTTFFFAEFASVLAFVVEQVWLVELYLLPCHLYQLWLFFHFQ
jgi:hypothetical protein